MKRQTDTPTRMMRLFGLFEGMLDRKTLNLLQACCVPRAGHLIYFNLLDPLIIPIQRLIASFFYSHRFTNRFPLFTIFLF